MMGTTSSITVQRLGEIEQRAPAVGAKMWCLYVCFCHAPSTVRLNGYTLSGFCVTVYGSILMPFSVFLDGLDSSHFCC